MTAPDPRTRTSRRVPDSQTIEIHCTNCCAAFALSAEAIRSGRKIVGYRRGDGRIRIHADTGSGDVVVAP